MQHSACVFQHTARMTKPQHGTFLFLPMTSPNLVCVACPPHHHHYHHHHHATAVTTTHRYEEDADRRERFYYSQLGGAGPPPATCTPDIMRVVVQQHLNSPSVFCILPIQVRSSAVSGSTSAGVTVQ